MIESYISKLSEQLLKQKEKIIFDQLGDLLRQGVLVIHETVPTLVKDADSDSVRLVQQVKLHCSQHERIEALLKENEELKRKIELIEGVLK